MKIGSLKSRFHSHRALARCQTAASTRTVSTVFAAFAKETVETVAHPLKAFSTGLKPGEN